MTTTATSAVGKFVWHELWTSDVEPAMAFYTGLFGWTWDEMPMGPGESYWMAKTGTEMIGGLMKAPMPDVPPNWLGYVAVADVDAAAKVAAEAGGKVLAPPSDIPNMGRFSVLQDAQGAAIAAWKSATPMDDDGAMPGAGEFCWDQLTTTDVGASAAFYGKVFGWTKKPFSAEPTPGTEDLVVYHRVGDQMTASAFPAPPNVPSHWQSFVAVTDLAASRAKAVELGGKVFVEQIDVPGIGTFAVLADPQGAVICAFQGCTP